MSYTLTFWGRYGRAPTTHVYTQYHHALQRFNEESPGRYPNIRAELTGPDGALLHCWTDPARLNGANLPHMLTADDRGLILSALLWGEAWLTHEDGVRTPECVALFDLHKRMKAHG